MKRLLSLVLTLAVMLSMTSGIAESGASAAEEPVRKIIIDTDTGADDSSAIILAARTPGIQILGVTVLAGNVDLVQGTRNVLAALELAGCDAPVYKGSNETYSGKEIIIESVFGKDGMGEKDLIHPTGKAQDKDAIDFILETVRENPGEVEIVMLGPATNIARAIDRDPETMKQVKKIWSMGTAGLGTGNATPVAEFNVYADAPAYRRLLDAGLPITIIGLDVCGGDALWTPEDEKKLAESGETGSFIVDSFSKLRELYAKNGSNGYMNCDSLAMACVVKPDFINDTILCYGYCETADVVGYAQVIFFKHGFTYDIATNDFNYNVTLVTEVDSDEYFDLYYSTVVQGAGQDR